MTHSEKDRIYTSNSDFKYWAPHGVKVSPDGKYLYVNVERTGNTRDPSPEVRHGQEQTKMLVFDLSTKKLDKEFKYNVFSDTDIQNSDLSASYDLSPGTHNFVFSPDGKDLWLYSGITGVSRMNPKTGEITARMNNFNGSVRALSFNKDGTLLVSATNEISFVDINSLKITKKIGNLGVGQILYSKATHDVKYVIAPAVWEGKLLIIDVEKEKIVKTISSGIDPVQVIISPDGKTAISTHGRSRWLTEINLEDFSVKKIIPTIGGPNGAAFINWNEKKAKKTVKFASFLSFTGNDSKISREIRLGYQFWKDKVNSAGGIYHNGQAYNVEIVYVDTESSQDYKYLKQVFADFIKTEEPDFILGTYGNIANKVASEIAEDEGMIYITSSGYQLDLYSNANKNTYGINSILEDSSYEAIKAIKSHISPKPQTIAIISSSHQIDFAQKERKLIESRGIKILGDKIHEFNIDIANEIAEKMAELMPDIILVLADHTESISLLKSLDYYDVTPGAIILNCGITMQYFAEKIGILSKNIMGSIQWSKKIFNSGHDRFVNAEDYNREYFMEYSEHPSQFAAGASATGAVFEEILRNSRSMDISEIRSATKKIDLATFYGHIKFGNDGANIAKETLFVQLQGQEISEETNEVLVWPRKFSGKNNVIWPFHKQ